MLGSSIRALVARVTIQKRALEAPNGLTCAPKRVRMHFDRAEMRAFVVRASSSGNRQDSPCNRPVSDPSMAHLP